jgi:hypothetical protein
MDCENLGGAPQEISFSESGPDGFLGVYDPDPFEVCIALSSSKS